MKKVLYIGNFSFPLGNAAGKRVYANGKILRELGYEVIFIGVDKDASNFCNLQQTEKEYDGFKCFNIQYPMSKSDWLKYKKVYSVVHEFILSQNIEDIDFIIYYGSPTISVFNTKLIKFCNKNNIKIFTDCVDWLSIKTNSTIYNIIKWIDNTYQKMYANSKTDGAIVISTYLKRYYDKVGIPTVIIPPLSPFVVDSNNVEIRNKIIISYAGIPFRKGQVITDGAILKDRLDLAIKMLYDAKKAGCDFVFNIYGFTKKDYLYSLPQQIKYVEGLSKNIVFHGYCENEIIMKNISSSHFTVLFRDVKRETSAGFPTKVSESISCGTPVITNDTSDLKKYIKDGYNGFLIDIANRRSEELIEVLKVTQAEISLMKKNCLHDNIFYYRNFLEDMETFIKHYDL